MKVMLFPLTALLLALPCAVLAAEPPMVEVAPVRAALLSFECEARALPSQRQVGEILGQYNFGQVYASRTRLMTEVSRACQRSGTERVDVVLQPTAPLMDAGRRVAVQEPRAR